MSTFFLSQKTKHVHTKKVTVKPTQEKENTKQSDKNFKKITLKKRKKKD